MSWVILAGDRVLKLKKPVRHAFLDFSTLQAREFYCREELRLNARLAPGVYLDVLALQWHDGNFSLLPAQRLPAQGQTVDWLVLMRRLPARHMLDQRIASGEVTPADIDALLAVLVDFYGHAPAVAVEPMEYLQRLQREQQTNRQVLLDPRWQLPGSAPALDRLDAALREQAPAAPGSRRAGPRARRPRRPAAGACVPAAPARGHRLPGVQRGAAPGRPFRRDRLPRARMRDGRRPVDRRTAVRRLRRSARRPARARHCCTCTPRSARCCAPGWRWPTCSIAVPRTPERWPARAQRYIERATTALDALDRRAAGGPMRIETPSRRRPGRRGERQDRQRSSAIAPVPAAV